MSGKAINQKYVSMPQALLVQVQQYLARCPWQDVNALMVGLHQDVEVVPDAPGGELAFAPLGGAAPVTPPVPKTPKG